MKNLITSAITLAFSVTSIADDHKPDWAVEIGNAVAQTVWLCDLINGSTMEDVTRIDKRLHKYLDTHQLRIKRDITPAITRHLLGLRLRSARVGDLGRVGSSTRYFQHD